MKCSDNNRLVDIFHDNNYYLASANHNDIELTEEVENELYMIIQETISENPKKYGYEDGSEEEGGDWMENFEIYSGFTLRNTLYLSLEEGIITGEEFVLYNRDYKLKQLFTI